jgi:hypothetical protein
VEKKKKKKKFFFDQKLNEKKVIMNPNNYVNSINYGGKGKVIPDFVEPINSPYYTTSAKQIQSQSKQEHGQTISGQTIPGPSISGGPNINPSSNINTTVQSGKQVQPIIDLQIYPEQKKPNPLADKQAMLPLQPFSLSSPFIPPQFQTYLNNFMKTFYTPFIYKDYHINLGGPNGDHIKASLIYEDALPSPEIYSSYKTIRERNSLCEYVRGTFITSDEGEYVDFNGSGPNSLNSRLKLIELNPYNTNLFSSNPYKNLPKGLLIYKSCYPIVYDKSSSLVQCNKTAVGLNLRVYKLTIKEFIVKYFNSSTKMENLKINNDLKQIIDKIKFELGSDKDLTALDAELKPINFDVWREISYYSFIRNKINYQNICPNFVKSYCYFINKNANISFNKNGLFINEIKNTSVSEILSDEFSNSTMILLTESPNQNIFQWGSNSYIQNKGIRKMVYSGYKPESHWKSIISQMLIIFYIMNKYNFTIREMDINANFYVKDLNVYGDNKQYWQYTIENIDYYIPNFGHLLMFDHNYKDLVKPENLNKQKIIMKDEFNNDSEEIRETILENAINCFNPNNFSGSYSEMGGVNLSNNILELLNRIYKDLKEINDNSEKKNNFIKDINDENTWGKILKKYLINYIHNRVGTVIRDLEVNYIRKNDSRPIPFKPGQLVILEEKFETYKIVLVIKNDSNCLCITRDQTSNEFIEIEYPKDILYHYLENETIKQDSKQGEPMIGYDYIIERYIL